MKQISRQDLEKLSHHKQVLFACFCTEQVMHLVKVEHKAVCLSAVQTAYLFLEGKASKEECRAAAAAAAAAAADAAAYAAYAATATADAAAYAAAYAAYAATAADAYTKQTIIKAQWDFYDQLLNSDKYFEEIILEVK
jgi:hypothetical protein